ncbi:YhgE/Pip domain-containing protein [Alkalihalobacterium elongatum]|uniref:YhgE/Pip domain-containing protein n=1 Tax=Alkalihalobacterium elongatum TaxID=2675466 RepID=UPI001C1F7998|nr:YhgE/Pip domain-containing protein [Alkalihalobacterium elongatum]
MGNIWSIFKQDLLNIKRVPLVGILLIGLAILPSLYAWFNLGAAWDPYANTKGVQVAVVNEDQGTEVEGEYLNIGEELVENLSKNENLGWSFVSREDAERGVEYGDYYASIFIDRHFSKDLVHVLSGDPVQAEVYYQVNEKINAIAPKMTSAGASTIVKEINDQFVAETSKALFQEFDKLGLRLEEELPTLRRIKQAIYDLERRFPEVNEFANWIIDLDKNWYKIEESVKHFLALEEFFPQIKEGADQILRLENEFPQLYKLGERILQLEEAIPEIETAVNELDKINAHYAEIADYLNEALVVTRTAQSTIRDVQGTLPAVEKRAESIEMYMEALENFINEAEGAAIPVIDTLTKQVLFISQTAAAIDQALVFLEDEQKQEKALETLKRLNHELNSHIRVLDNAIDMYTILFETSSDEGILTIIDQLTQTKNLLESLQRDVESIIVTVEEGGSVGSDQLHLTREKVQEVQQASKKLHALLQGEGDINIEGAFDQIQSKLYESKTSIEEVYAELKSIEEVLNYAEKISIESEESISRLIDRLPEIEKRMNELTERIQGDLPLVITTIEALSTFVRNDLPVIENKVNSISKLIKEELPGVEEEYWRLAKALEENIPHIQQSIKELAEFGRNQLPEVEENIREVADRVWLIESDDRINEMIEMLRNDLDEESEFFASPVHLIEEDLFPIPNYGSANAPFYTTLSLWVGALLLSNLISTNLHAADRREEFTLRQIYFGRMFLFLIVGVLQGLIVSIGNLTILGIYAAHPWLLILFSVIIAVIFMTMVYTLASILGNIGKALAIVLLVLQLSSGGGTFPIEVAPPFFQMVHPYMPFSYAINLLREAVGGAIAILVWKNLLILGGFWLLALTIGCLLKPKLSARIQETYEKSKSSRLVD